MKRRILTIMLGLLCCIPNTAVYAENINPSEIEVQDSTVIENNTKTEDVVSDNSASEEAAAIETVSEDANQEVSENEISEKVTTEENITALPEDDTSEAMIYEKGVIVGGVEKSKKTAAITLKAVGFEYLVEKNFDKEIYAVLRNANTYKRYGVILNTDNGYEATINVPAGHYLLSKVGLTHGKAVDYFSVVYEVIGAPGSEETLEFKLYSQETEEKKAKEMYFGKDDTEEEEKPQTESEKREYVTPATGPDTSYTVISTPKDTFNLKNLAITIISVLAILLSLSKWKKKKEEEKRKEEKEDF